MVVPLRRSLRSCVPAVVKSARAGIRRGRRRGEEEEGGGEGVLQWEGPPPRPTRGQAAERAALAAIMADADVLQLRMRHSRFDGANGGRPKKLLTQVGGGEARERTCCVCGCGVPLAGTPR